MGKCFIMIGDNPLCPKCDKEGETLGLITYDDVHETIDYFCNKCKTRWKVRVQALPDEIDHFKGR
jgi:transcription elongation factor Elf1